MSEENWREKAIRLENEVKKLKLIVDKIKGLKLVTQDDDDFSLIEEALYTARRYWYDNLNNAYCREIDHLDIHAVILTK